MLFFLTKHRVPLMVTILCSLKFLFPKRLPFIAIEHLNNTVSKILHRTEPSKFDPLFQLNDQHRGTIFLLSHRLPHSMQAPHAMRDPLHTGSMRCYLQHGVTSQLHCPLNYTCQAATGPTPTFSFLLFVW